MSDIEEVELSRDHAKELIRKRDKALKLASNREFKELVLEGYFRDEPARLASAFNDPAMSTHREALLSQFKAIGQFEQYLRTIVIMGNAAASELVEHEELLDELREETL